MPTYKWKNGKIEKAEKPKPRRTQKAEGFTSHISLDEERWKKIFKKKI